MTARHHRLAGALLCILAAAPGPARPQELGATLAQSRNLLRADRLLQSGEVASGELEVTAEVALGPSGSSAAIAVSLATAETPPSGTRWAFTLLAPAVDREPLIHRGLVEWSLDGAPGARPATGWVYFGQVVIPEDFQDAAIAVENLNTGGWGAALVELTDQISQAPPGLAVLDTAGSTTPVDVAESRRPVQTPETAPTRTPRTTPDERQPIGASRPAPPTQPGAEVIKLIPPADRPA